MTHITRFVVLMCVSLMACSPQERPARTSTHQPQKSSTMKQKLPSPMPPEGGIEKPWLDVWDEPMLGVDDSEQTLRGSVGEKGLLVVFTCNHCPWAKAWHERIVSLGHAYQDKGIGVIAINSNDPTQYPSDGFEVMKRVAQQSRLKFPYVVDKTSHVARAFGAKKTPEVFLFDESLDLIYQGAVDDDVEATHVQKHYLKEALEALSMSQSHAVRKTFAIGCSIKFRPSVHPK